MARQLIRLEQIRKTRDDEDQLTPEQVKEFETWCVTHFDFLKAMLSQFKRIMYGDDAGNWNDNPAALLAGQPATLKALFSRDVREADCTVAEEVSDFVYVTGDPVGGRDQVRKADPSSYDNLPAVGVVIQKDGDDRCFVQWLGETPSIFTGLSTGEIYFLGADSKIAEIPPDPTPGGMFVQPIGVAVGPDRIYVRPESNLTLRRSV